MDKNQVIYVDFIKKFLEINKCITIEDYEFIADVLVKLSLKNPESTVYQGYMVDIFMHYFKNYKGDIGIIIGTFYDMDTDIIYLISKYPEKLNNEVIDAFKDDDSFTWEEISKYIGENKYSKINIAQFVNYINWDVTSDNLDGENGETNSLLLNFEDNLNWKIISENSKLSNNRYIFNNFYIKNISKVNWESFCFVLDDGKNRIDGMFNTYGHNIRYEEFEYLVLSDVLSITRCMTHPNTEIIKTSSNHILNMIKNGKLEIV